MKNPSFVNIKRAIWRNLNFLESTPTYYYLNNSKQKTCAVLVNPIHPTESRNQEQINPIFHLALQQQY
jgi:hypothetical protein